VLRKQPRKQLQLPPLPQVEEKRLRSPPEHSEQPPEQSLPEPLA